MKAEYNLTFYEAIDKCLLEDYYIIGEDFGRGCYCKNNNNAIIIMEMQDNKLYVQHIDNLMITKALLQMKFRAIVVANAKNLGMED